MSPLKGLATDLELLQTHSLWASAQEQQLEGTSGIRGESEVSGIRTSARGQLLPEARLWHCPFSEISPTQSHRAVIPETPSIYLTRVALALVIT